MRKAGLYPAEHGIKGPLNGRLWTAAEGVLEARAGIEPACEDLQSSTSPLRHRAEAKASLRQRPARVKLG